MNLHDTHSGELDTALKHSLKNWAAEQQPANYMRARILKKAAENSKPNPLGKHIMMTLKRLNPYWTGRPLNHSELTKWMFSQAMIQSFSMDRHAIRMVC